MIVHNWPSAAPRGRPFVVMPTEVAVYVATRVATADFGSLIGTCVVVDPPEVRRQWPLVFTKELARYAAVVVVQDGRTSCDGVDGPPVAWSTVADYHGL